MDDWTEEEKREFDEARRRARDEHEQIKVGDVVETPGGLARVVAITLGGYEVRLLSDAAGLISIGGHLVRQHTSV